MQFTRITRHADICNGQPCIRGLRMPVASIIGMVAAGMTDVDILHEHPTLEAADIQEALLYHAQAAYFSNLLSN